MKSGLLSLNLDDSGYHLNCFAPEKGMLIKILQKTSVSSAEAKRFKGVAIGDQYFSTYRDIKELFADMFLNGIKQAFFHTQDKKYYLATELTLGNTLYPSLSKVHFMDNQY